jgi:hypothetical protein
MQSADLIQGAIGTVSYVTVYTVVMASLSFGLGTIDVKQ